MQTGKEHATRISGYYFSILFSKEGHDNVFVFCHKLCFPGNDVLMFPFKRNALLMFII